ncbi:MAG: class I SAM-dependent methyltransferase [Pseudomonadota bacterium]
MTRTLKEQAELLVTSDLPPEALTPEVLRFGRILADARPQKADAKTLSDDASQTDKGWAISPLRAQMCLADSRRSLEFMCGVYEAIRDLRTQITNRPVRILYAGCGPLASLVMPSLAIFLASELQVTLLDMHAESLASAEQLINAHNLSDRISAFVEGDAGLYLIDKYAPPDIVLMEILESCLDQEPQVGVSRHLMTQCPDAILIPRDITVSMALVNPDKEFSPTGNPADFDRILIGDVFSLNKEAIASWAHNEGDILPAETVTVPDYDRRTYIPVLRTVIQTYGGHMLHDYHSGLTVPRSHNSLADAKPGARLTFQYRDNRQPGLFANSVAR